MAISKAQPMRPALIDAVDSINSGTSGSGTLTVAFPLEVDSDGRVTLKYDDTSLSTSDAGVLRVIPALVDVIQSVPTIDHGTSNSITVPANSIATVDVSFIAKVEVPIVFTSLQYAGSAGALSAYVSSVSNSQASIVIRNDTSTDADDVTIDWLTISGR